MAKYRIEVPHTGEQCMAALDEIAKYNVGLLDEAVFGCMSGDHRGWAILDAESEAAVRGRLPTVLSGEARIVKVDRLSREQIEAAHKM